MSEINYFGVLGSSKCKKCKKALDVCKKLLAHKSSFWTLQEVVQVVDYKGFKKPNKNLSEINNFGANGQYFDSGGGFKAKVKVALDPPKGSPSRRL